MTALNVIVRPEAVYLATDGAYYDEQGFLYGFAPKTYALSHWPGAIATRGPALALALIGAEVGLLFEDIDSFALQACEFLRVIVSRPEWEMACRVERKAVDLVVVGWSAARNAPRAFMLSSGLDSDLARPDLDEAWEGMTLDGSEGYVLTEIDAAMMLPIPNSDLLDGVGISPDMDLDEIEPVDLAMRMLCAQRQWKDAPAAGGEPTHFVGGFGMLTTVTNRVVSQMKTNDWPDSIGRRIKARPFDLIPVVGASEPAPPVVPPPAMNRQQRRAWEAQQRERGAGRLRTV